MSTPMNVPDNSYWEHIETKNMYQVLMVTNQKATRPDWKTTIVYRNVATGETWSRPLGEWTPDKYKQVFPIQSQQTLNLRIFEYLSRSTVLNTVVSANVTREIMKMIEADKRKPVTVQELDQFQQPALSNPPGITEDEATVMEALDFGQFSKDMVCPVLQGGVARGMSIKTQEALNRVLKQMYSRLYGPKS